jgi:ABC-type multidrug transport system ATPase subunit
LDKSLLIDISQATFRWNADDGGDDAKSSTSEERPLASTTAAVLQQITLRVGRKQLVGVCGGVGAGKTALLNAIAGEVWHSSGTAARLQMYQVDGKLLITNSIAYVPQQPWILNATLRYARLLSSSVAFQREHLAR